MQFVCEHSTRKNLHFKNPLLKYAEEILSVVNKSAQSIEKLVKKEEKIIEAGNWWQHFKTTPFQETLEAFGSPIYGMKMAPYWNQYLGLHQGYFGGRGEMYPQINYETFGTSFTQLPVELGGSRGGGAGSRMGGRGME